MAITLDGTTGTTTPALTNSALTSGRVTYAGTSGVLQDSANLTFDGSTLKVSTSNPFIDIAAAAATQGSFRVVGNGGTLGTNSFDFIQSTDQTGYIFNRANLPIIFGTNNTEAMRLTVNGTVILKGGSTSATGVGIAFPATQSASSDVNTLDDYEEGTWTPNQGSGLTVTGTFSSNGTYTKVGRMVNVTMRLNGSSNIAVNLNGLITTNLPFAWNGSLWATGSLVIAPLVTTGSGVCAINEATTNAYSATNVTTATSFSCSFTYPTN